MLQRQRWHEAGRLLDFINRFRRRCRRGNRAGIGAATAAGVGAATAAGVDAATAAGFDAGRKLRPRSARQSQKTIRRRFRRGAGRCGGAGAGLLRILTRMRHRFGGGNRGRLRLGGQVAALQIGNANEKRTNRFISSFSTESVAGCAIGLRLRADKGCDEKATW